MKRVIYRLISVLCAFALFTGIAGCGNDKTADNKVQIAPDAVDASSLDEVSTKVKQHNITDSADNSDNTEIRVGVTDSLSIPEPFGFEAKRDSSVTDLVMLKLVETDRNGYVIRNGIDGETSFYNGNEYTYDGIADVEINGNTLNFTLREDIYFSDGVNLTADDVIFTMYVLLDPAYDGISTFALMPIAGLSEYRGQMQQKWKTILSELNSGGKSKYYSDSDKADFINAFNKAGIEFTKDIVNGCAENFAAEYSVYVLGISEDALKDNEGYKVAFAQYIWDESTGYGEDGLWYDIEGNAYDFIESFPTIEDYWELIFNKYGYDIGDDGINYEKIGDRSFQDILISIINREYPNLMVAENDGGTAENIKGIEKTGMYSFSVTLENLIPEYLNAFCLYIAPLHKYGSREEYKYTENRFGFSKGNISEIKERITVPLGAGAYIFSEFDEGGEIKLKCNSLYYKGCPKIKTLVLTEDCEGADIYLKEFTDAGMNTENYISSETNTYIAVGINAKAVSVCGEELSDASVSLRNAIATIIRAYSVKAVEQWGNQYAACTTDDIELLDTASEENVRAEVIELLKKAGYIWNGDKEIFTAPPNGAKMSYEIKLYEYDAAYIALNYAKELLQSIGISLKISVQSSGKSLENLVNAGEAEIWVMKLDNFTTDDVYELLHSNGENNVFAVSTEAMDSSIEWADGLFLKNVSVAAYDEIMEDATALGVIIPVYKMLNAVVYSDNIVADSITKDMTDFWPWTREAYLLEVK